MDEPPASIDCYLHTLAADERTKAERYYFERDRLRFIIAHGVLRAILSLYLNESPKRLSFCEGSHGKPALALDSGGDSIRFNMSHSHRMALYAVTRSREVGIDLEFVRCDLEAEQIAERVFSPREIAELRALPAALRRNAFFLCWTRKEAYIKAKGEGLSLPLDQFDVSLIPGEPAALQHAARFRRGSSLASTGADPRPRLCGRTCGRRTRLVSILLANRRFGSDPALNGRFDLGV